MKISLGSNSKIFAINSIMSVGVKIGAIFIALFTTPAYIRYFDNNEILGAWFTILSILNWILYCDMGIGNGLRNSLVYAITNKNRQEIEKLISSSYIFLISVAVITVGCLIFIGGFVNWNKIFNISASIIDESTLEVALTILISSILIQFILRLITSILYALQKAFLPGLLSLITNLIMLLSVLLLNYLGKNNDIIQLAGIYFFGVNIPLIVTTVWVFSHDLREYRFSIQSFSMQSAKIVLSTGTVFLWLQLMSLLLDNTNSYLISAFISNAAVVEYQIYYKVFSLPGTMVLLVSTVIWSIITKAKAEKNYVWLKKSYYLFMLFCFGISAFEFLLIPMLQFLFDIWLEKDSILVNYRYAFVFAISGSVMAYRIFLCTYSNGLCKLKNQVIWLTVGAIANIPLAYILSYILNDMVAVILANIICMLPYCIVDTFNFCRGLSLERVEEFAESRNKIQ